MSIDGTLANRYFLVVDDEESIRSLAVRFLSEAGAAGVVEAVDGAAAIAAMQTSDIAFDAVISDVDMKPMSGLALLKAIRTGEYGLHRNTPVVLLTAHGDADLLRAALALDANAFVLKPVGRDEFTERVVRVIERALAVQSKSVYTDVHTGVVSGMPSVVAPPQDDDVPRGAKRMRLGLVPAGSQLAVVILGSDGRPLVDAGTILRRELLARLDDLRKIHPAVRELTIVEP
jgi:CheY-like chemotaxis protein